MNKPVLTDHEFSQFAQIFKALGDETRQRILVLLTERPLSVKRIVAHFTLAQPTISRHLAVLRQAQLVTGARSRQQIIYRLAPDTLKLTRDRFFTIFCAEEPGATS